MGKLTTHVLDTSRGCPASGLRVSLRRGWEASQPVLEAETNSDGRLDAPLLDGEAFQTGKYELVFHAGEYLRRTQKDLPDPLFLSEIPIRFAMAEDTHYHVPLLLSPFGYSTYRGS